MSPHVKAGQESDSHLLWLWVERSANLGRLFFFGLYSWEEHQHGLQNLADPDSFSYIAVNASNTPVGLIRFKKAMGMPLHLWSSPLSIAAGDKGWQ